MAIEFKNPPKILKGPRIGGKHVVIADALKCRPGEWALVLEGVSVSTARYIKNGTYAAYRPAGAFDATYRTSPKGEGMGDIYARYIGK